jgi:formylglycine-generating enzyme required for sulfatase activity
VTISKGFWINKYPLTQQEYKDVMGNNPSSHNTGNSTLPVENVTWFDATNYCFKLTLVERSAGRLPDGYVYRLPTDAEWEYACRAGTTNRFFFGDDPSYTQLGDYSWYSKNSGNQTHPVGSLKPNPWGLYDINGNVDQWCSDWFDYYLAGGSVTDPKGPTTDRNATRVVRGGYYTGQAHECRMAVRNALPQSLGQYNIGFRPVLAQRDSEHSY